MEVKENFKKQILSNLIQIYAEQENVRVEINIEEGETNEKKFRYK